MVKTLHQHLLTNIISLPSTQAVSLLVCMICCTHFLHKSVFKFQISVSRYYNIVILLLHNT